MRTNTVFLASKHLLEFDRASAHDFMPGVEVTNQCYNALKAGGFLLGREEKEKLEKVWNFSGYWKTRSYGGLDGFSYKELRKFLGRSLLTAAQVRAL